MNSRYCMRSLFSLLLVLCVLFSNLFCVIAQAQEIDYSEPGFADEGESLALDDSLTGDDFTLKYYLGTTVADGVLNSKGTTFETGSTDDKVVSIELTMPSNSVISKGEVFDMSFYLTFGGVSRVHWCYVYGYNSNWYTVMRNENPVYSSSGAQFRYEFNDCVSDNSSINVIRIICKVTPSSGTFTVNPSKIQITPVSDTGLISGLLNFVKNIWEGIKNLPGNIANAISGFFDMLKNAIEDLGTFLIDGIKNLFIPSQTDITNMQTKWNTLLEDRFGALYQAIDIIHDYADSFQANSKGTIDMPSISVPVAGSSFEFGGQTVQVIPTGFGFLFDALKLMISIISTFAFVNAMKNRLEKLVGGSSNI